MANSESTNKAKISGSRADNCYEIESTGLSPCVARRQHGCSHTLFHLFVLIVALVALATSIASLLRSKQQLDHRDFSSDGIDLATEQATLHEVEAMLEDLGEMFFDNKVPRRDAVNGYHEQRRSVEPSPNDENVCSSSNETGHRPLAHIVSPHVHTSRPLPDDGAKYSVLSKQWLCGEDDNDDDDSTNTGQVRGGMIFHRNSGFLELPRDGIYYIYSQVTFRPGRSSPRKGTARMVACIPGVECNYAGDVAGDTPYVQTQSNVDGRYGNSKFQAGLFHFPAGTQIAVVIWNELYQRKDLSALRHDGTHYSTFMGGFLVDGDLM